LVAARKSVHHELIGVAATSTEERLTPPVKPEDLAALLDQMEADGRHDLRLATGLIALFGLRPAELAVLTTKGDKLYAGAVKRNIATLAQKAKPPRRCLPLDIAGREGEGKRLLQLYSSGLVKLPASVLNEISKVEEKGTFQQVGHAFGQLLKRYEPWKTWCGQMKASRLTALDIPGPGAATFVPTMGCMFGRLRH